jgi:ankyrin repeat protein
MTLKENDFKILGQLFDEAKGNKRHLIEALKQKNTDLFFKDSEKAELIRSAFDQALIKTGKSNFWGNLHNAEAKFSSAQLIKFAEILWGKNALKIVFSKETFSENTLLLKSGVQFASLEDRLKSKEGFPSESFSLLIEDLSHQWNDKKLIELAEIYDEHRFLSFEDIYTACKNGGNLERIKESLEDNPEYLYQKDSYFQTLLMIACKSGRLGMVHMLLTQEDCALNETDPLGQTALFKVITATPLFNQKDFEENRLEIIKALLEHDEIDCTQQDNQHGQTVLSLACAQGQLEIVKLLLPKSDINLQNKHHALEPIWGGPLYSAIVYGYQDIAQLLIHDSRLDYDAFINHFEKSPLKLACEHGRQIVIDTLLKAGFEIAEAEEKFIEQKLASYSYNQKLTYLEMALQKGSNRLAQVLIQTMTNDIDPKTHPQLLFNAAKYCDLQTIKVLYEASYKPGLFYSEMDNLNRVDDTGRTLLHYAVLYKNAPLIDWLRNKNIDLTIKDHDRKTAEDYAQSSKIVERLTTRIPTSSIGFSVFKIFSKGDESVTPKNNLKKP